MKTINTMDHSQLVAELPQLETMSAAERIEMAKKRRFLQLQRFQEYDNSNPAPPTRRPKLKFSPGIALLEATSRGDAYEVERLLKAGSDPNSHNEDGLTPLHQCAIDDNEQLVRLLLRYNADVNAKDTELWTPLHAASCCGYIEIVRLLIANDADLLAVNSEGNMPYDLCDVEQTLDVIESEMAKRGITQELIEEKRGEPERRMLADMKHLKQNGDDLEFRQPNGSTYLHAAAASGYFDVVAFLLRVGVPPNLKDNDGWTPLHAAAHWNQTDIIELLCEYGAKTDLTTAQGESVIDLAEDANTKTVIQTISSEQARKKRMAFGVRDSRRQSRRRKKYESPQPLPQTSGENPFSARGAIRRQSLRDRTGYTPARLEAKQEQSNLIRTWSGEDMSNNQEDVSQYQGGRDPSSKSSPNKRALKSGTHKTKPLSPDEWVKSLEAENNADDDDDIGLNRSSHGRSGSRKKKKRPPGIDYELNDIRGGAPGINGAAGKSNNYGPTQNQDKKNCCCTIL